MRYGTSYFVSFAAALNYYAQYDANPLRAVERKVADGEIHWGEQPPLKPGQRLRVIPGEGRYEIIEDRP